MAAREAPHVHPHHVEGGEWLVFILGVTISYFVTLFVIALLLYGLAGLWKATSHRDDEIGKWPIAVAVPLSAVLIALLWEPLNLPQVFLLTGGIVGGLYIYGYLFAIVGGALLIPVVAIVGFIFSKEMRNDPSVQNVVSGVLAVLMWVIIIALFYRFTDFGFWGSVLATVVTVIALAFSVAAVSGALERRSK